MDPIDPSSHQVQGMVHPAGNVSTSLESDADLVAVQAATLDLQHFAPIYNRHAPAVYTYCLRRLGDRERAEDVTSIVFTRAMQSLGSFRNTGHSFRAWLFTIAHHAVADAHRESAKPLVWLDEHVPDSRPSPEESALIANERDRLAALLAMLSTDQRRVVELRLAGLTGEEIAEVLGKNHGAIRQLQFRAMQRLQFLAGQDTHQLGEQST